MGDLSVALQITAVGMGLVFAAIVLLWLVMAALVRLAVDPAEDKPGESVIAANGPAAVDRVDLSIGLVERKRRAAVIAVAVALAHQSVGENIHEFPLPPTALVSAWQAIMRTRMLNKRGPTR